jgi:hypothetical protein
MRSFRFTPAFVAGTVLWMLPATFLAKDLPDRAWVEALASEEFRTREQAQLDLSEWAASEADRGESWLLRELDAADDPEIRLRLSMVLRRMVIEEHQNKGPGYVGIRMDPVELMVPGDPEPRGGVRILAVEGETPASRAGLRAGDVIVALDRLTWKGAAALKPFAEEIKRHKPGTSVQLSILRDGELRKVPVILGPRPLSLPELGVPIPAEDAEVLEERAKDALFERWLSERRAGKPAR